MADLGDDIRQSVEKIGRAVRQIQASGLTERALETWLYDLTGVQRQMIRRVLDGMERLEEYALGGDDD